MQVAHTPTLRNWQASLHQCAIDQPGIALIVHETTAIDPKIWNANVTLWFGEPAQGILQHAVVLGVDEIVLIGGQSVDIQDLTEAQLQAIYSDPDSIYQTWTYPEENELRIIFDQALFDESFSAPNSYLAPNPAAMIEAISTNAMAIGFLPKSWVTGNEKIISFENSFEQPILGLTVSEPQGEVGTFLSCLQNINP
jgi:hypothetical protein